MYRVLFHKRSDCHDRPVLKDCWSADLKSSDLASAMEEVVSLLSSESDHPKNGILIGDIVDSAEIIEVIGDISTDLKRHHDTRDPIIAAEEEKNRKIAESRMAEFQQWQPPQRETIQYLEAEPVEIFITEGE